MKLSIIVPTYNHEKYIVKALDSIIAQNIQYSFEVLVGEDCSTDNTRAILKDYEKQHPGIFTIFYREVNMYQNSTVGNGGDLRNRAKGEYIITLEGDDFWTDPNKINRQIHFLDTHPEYIAVAHNCVMVDENGNPNGEKYPECKTEEYTINDWYNKIYAGHFNSIMLRNIFLDSSYNTSLMKKRLSPGDYLLLFMLLTYGKIYCIQEVMSAYRHVTTSGSSRSATYKHNSAKHRAYCREIVLYSHDTGKYILEAENKYIQCLYYERKSGNISRHEFKQSCKILKDKTNYRKQLIKLHYVSLRMFLSNLKKNHTKKS